VDAAVMPGRRMMSMLGAMALGASLVAAGCGDSSQTTDAAERAKTRLVGTPTDPIEVAPPLALDNYLGQPVNLEDYRGKAVFITFVYVHCPDVCPLIVSNMRAAQNELGPDAQDVRFIAVSVDPEKDTPQSVKEFLKERQMTGRMEYLIGSRPQLEQVWHEWDIISKHNPKRKIPDYVEHSALVYGISADGKLTTLYPAEFKPHWIVHDAPLLAAQ
jgi:protein SCO1/2